MSVDMSIDHQADPADDVPSNSGDFLGNENIFPTPPENPEDVHGSECIAENEFAAGAERMYVLFIAITALKLY